MNILNKLFSNPTDSLAIFSRAEIDALEFYEKGGKWFLKTFEDGGKDKMIWSETKTVPEEIVRQLFANRLVKKYGYPRERMRFEVEVQFGREIGPKRADIVVYRKDGKTEYLIVETKKPDVKDGLGQLKSYGNATAAPLLVLTDGKLQYNMLRTDPNFFEDLPDIPRVDETIEDVRKKKITYKDLAPVPNLKKLVLDLENVVLAHAGVNAFEEIFKLIYAKLYDELETPRNENRCFRVIAGATNKENLEQIEKLFEDAKREWSEVFRPKDEIEIPASAIVPAVSMLQKYRLFESDLQVIDDAFEHLIAQDSKGEKGQYFTPRIMIDMCVRMLRPTAKETILDPSSGSCGFLLHAMQHVWGNELSEEKYGKEEYKARQKKYANEKLFGIDFDPRAVKIGKAMMLIAGDGKTNVHYANSLSSEEWSDEVRAKFQKLLWPYKELAERKRNEEQMRDFAFDIVLSNPPFAGDVSGTVLNHYDLGFKFQDGKKTNKHQNKVDRHILFIERNLNFLRPGGRMAIVLPQGIFNNTSEEHIRKFIMQHARILAVVGVDNNAFKPHNGVKTSVLIVQKWGDGNPKQENYPIFFATSKLPFKDNSGEYVYRDASSRDTKNLRSDLFEIAEAFCEWGKGEKINFLSK